MTTMQPRRTTESETCNSTGVVHNGGQPRITGWSRAFADDIDNVVVERLVDGHRVECTAWERRAAVAELRREGRSHSQIADHLHMAERQVVRDLERAGMTNMGWLAIQKERATRRRVFVARLHGAGARVSEIARLLDSDTTIIGRDLTALRLPRHPVPRRRCPARTELLAAFGHLLADEVAA